MSHQYKAVAAILKNTIASINEILKDPADELHRIRITNDLQLQHDRLLLITGSGDLETGQPAVLGPAKTIGGKPIAKQRRFTADDMIPADDKVHNLRKQVDAAVLYFGVEASAEGILANIPELIIRGVAKKAGLKVTKDEPKEITVEFIEKIKEVVAAAGLKGEAADDEDDEEELVETDIENLDSIAKAAIEEQLNEGLANAIMGGDPTAPVGDGMMTKQAEAPKEQPKADEPKQENKPDPKKKTAK
jgi:hypothetical protein